MVPVFGKPSPMHVNNDATPKPSPELFPTPTTPAERTAGFHAREARRLLLDVSSILAGDKPSALPDAVADLSAAATAHALTSLAFTQLSPPPRRRPRPCAAPAVVVTR